MKNHLLTAVLLFSVLSLFISCSEEPEKKEDGFSISIKDGDGESIDIKIDGKKDLENAMNDLENSLESLGKELKNIDISLDDEDGEKIETVDGKELKKILPKRIAGIRQSNSQSNTAGIFGFKVTTAKAEYEEDDEQVKVEILDVGGMGKMAKKFADWTDLEVDSEDSDGSFKRTTLIEGHPAIEEYKARREKYEVAAFVNNHFVVKIEGRNVKLSKLKYVVENIIDDLEDL